MRLKKMPTTKIILVTLLILAVVLPVFVNRAEAQTSSKNYWVTVKPMTDAQMYTTVGSNLTLSFEALWSYGEMSGQPISNATVSVKVSGTNEGILNTLQLNSTSGIFSFNYFPSTADKIIFTPTELKTQKGTQYTPATMKIDNNQAYGFQSEPVTVWWDTFQVSVVRYNTDTSKVVAVSVNVTSLLLPQNGLTLPSQDTYSKQTFLPKIISDANVTINGVQAQESSIAGIYSANVSTIFPTAYVLVTVSHTGWATAQTAFSFTQKANDSMWNYALTIALIIVAASLPLYFVFFKKPTKPTAFIDKAKFPFIGAILLFLSSVVSLYWGILALEATMNGFNWTIWAAAGLGSFAIGVLGGVMSLRKKNEALVILSVCIPIAVNIIAVKFSLDEYQLAIPWLFIILSMAASIMSGLLITNSEDQFS